MTVINIARTHALSIENLQQRVVAQLRQFQASYPTVLLSCSWDPSGLRCSIAGSGPWKRMLASGDLTVRLLLNLGPDSANLIGEVTSTGSRFNQKAEETALETFKGMMNQLVA